jgi:hypothetical protein
MDRLDTAMTERTTPRALARLAVVFATLAGCNSLDDLWSDATTARPLDPASAPNGPDDDAGALPLAPEVDASTAEPQGADATVFPGQDDASTEDVAAEDAAATDAGDGAVENRPTITSVSYRAPIVEAPQANARWIGYVRAGGRVPSCAAPSATTAARRAATCRRGLVRGRGRRLRVRGDVREPHRVARAPAHRPAPPTQPDIDASMPFHLRAQHPPAAMYRWLPSEDDEREVEPERFAPRAAAGDAVDGGGGDDARGDGGASPRAPPRRRRAVRIEDLEGARARPCCAA